MRLIKNYYFLIFPGLFLIFLILLELFTSIEGIWLRAIIAFPLAYLLSPKTKIVKKLHAKEKHLRWLFSKKIIYIKLKE